MDTRKIHVSRDVKFDETKYTLAMSLQKHATMINESYEIPPYDDTTMHINMLSKQNNKYDHCDSYFEPHLLPD